MDHNVYAVDKDVLELVKKIETLSRDLIFTLETLSFKIRYDAYTPARNLYLYEINRELHLLLSKAHMITMIQEIK